MTEPKPALPRRWVSKAYRDERATWAFADQVPAPVKTCDEYLSLAEHQEIVAEKDALLEEAEQTLSLHRENYLTVAAQRDKLITKCEKLEHAVLLAVECLQFLKSDNYERDGLVYPTVSANSAAQVLAEIENMLEVTNGSE